MPIRPRMLGDRRRTPFGFWVGVAGVAVLLSTILGACGDDCEEYPALCAPVSVGGVAGSTSSSSSGAGGSGGMSGAGGGGGMGGAGGN